MNSYWKLYDNLNHVGDEVDFDDVQETENLHDDVDAIEAQPLEVESDRYHAYFEEDGAYERVLPNEFDNVIDKWIDLMFTESNETIDREDVQTLVLAIVRDEYKKIVSESIDDFGLVAQCCLAFDAFQCMKSLAEEYEEVAERLYHALKRDCGFQHFRLLGTRTTPVPLVHFLVQRSKPMEQSDMNKMVHTFFELQRDRFEEYTIRPDFVCLRLWKDIVDSDKPYLEMVQHIFKVLKSRMSVEQIDSARIKIGRMANKKVFPKGKSRKDVKIITDTVIKALDQPVRVKALEQHLIPDLAAMVESYMKPKAIKPRAHKKQKKQTAVPEPDVEHSAAASASAAVYDPNAFDESVAREKAQRIQNGLVVARANNALKRKAGASATASLDGVENEEESKSDREEEDEEDERQHKIPRGSNKSVRGGRERVTRTKSKRRKHRR